MPERRHDADVGPAGARQLRDLAGRDADVALAGADDARGSSGRGGGCDGWSRLSTLKTRASSWAGMPSVMQTTNRTPAAAASRMAAGGGLGRHRDERGVGAGGGHRVGHGVEDRDALDVLAALARGHAGHDLRAVVPVAQAVEAALAAGEALHDHLGVLVDEDGHGCLLRRWRGRRRRGAASSMVGLEISRTSGMPASARMRRPSSALVPSRRMTIGARRSTRDSASTIPLATSSPRVMPPKMLMKIERTRLVEVDDLERGRHHVGVGAAADVEEVGRPATDLVDDVERAHGQAGAVGDDADRTLEADVLQALVPGQALALVQLLGRRELLPLRVAEGGVVVEADLGVEGVHLAGRLEDQRVDLGEVAVALGVAAVELARGSRPRRRRRPG